MFNVKIQYLPHFVLGSLGRMWYYLFTYYGMWYFSFLSVNYFYAVFGGKEIGAENNINLP